MTLKQKPTPPRTSVRRKRVTARDVALHAGVSEAAVSLVLSGRDDITIARKTRERIRKKAEELGYIPSLLGKGFLQGGSRIVGMVMPYPIYGQWLEGFGVCYQMLKQAGYAPLVMVPHNDVKRSGRAGEDMRAVIAEKEEVRRLLQYQVDGVFYCSLDVGQTARALAELIQYGVPTVLIGPRPDHCPVDYACVNELKVGRLAARHLLALGVSSFAMIELKAPHSNMLLRRDGFLTELARHGITVPVLGVSEGDMPTLVKRLSDHLTPPAGVFAANDVLAAMAIQASPKLNWRVPDDLAVIGIGNYQLARYNAVPMATIHRNSAKAVGKAMDMLLERMAGYDGPPRSVLVTPRLVVRRSAETTPRKRQPASRRR